MTTHKFTRAGKTTIAMGLFGVLAVAAVGMIGGYSAKVGASSAQTAVKVLNTPPIFDNGNTAQAGFPFEVIAAATTSPWLYGNQYAFSAHAHDTSGDNMWLLVCDSSSTAPTANTGAAPVCGGGAGHQIAVSSTFFTGSSATTSISIFATTTVSTTTSEVVNWVGYVCDDVGGNPRCSAASPGQAGQDNASPYAVTHPFTFQNLLAFAGFNPDVSQTITSSSSQVIRSDSNNGTVTAKLHLCKSAVPGITSTGCGAGNFFASSTIGANKNASSTVVFSTPAPWGNFTVYPYIVDQYGYQAIGAGQGSSTIFVVNNVPPVTTNLAIASSSINLYNPGGYSTSSAYAVTFDVSDNNGCLTQGAQNEMSTATLQFYRNNATCAAGTDQDDHSCYNTASTTSMWAASTTCVQNSCLGYTSHWTCTFPLSYMTDPTGAGTPWNGIAWRARVSTADFLGLASAATTSIADSQMNPFLYVDLSASSIDFGQWQPGQGNTVLGVDQTGATSSLDVITKGNTSVDMAVKSSHMCPTYSTGTPCTGNESGDTIFGTEQHFATSTLSYASGMVSSSTGDIPFPIHVPKNTILNNFNKKSTYWGISVPGTLTMSGDYKGLNTLTMSVNPTTSSW